MGFVDPAVRTVAVDDEDRVGETETELARSQGGVGGPVPVGSDHDVRRVGFQVALHPVCHRELGRDDPLLELLEHADLDAALLELAPPQGVEPGDVLYARVQDLDAVAEAGQREREKAVGGAGAAVPYQAEQLVGEQHDLLGRSRHQPRV